MANIFETRKLASSFIYRNVVFTSSAGISSKKLLQVTQNTDFGTMGMWSNNVRVDLDVESIEDTITILEHHEKDILEQIGVLEDIISWVKRGYKLNFQEVLMQHKPILFNALLINKTLTVQIFGEGMLDLEFRCDITAQRGTQTLINRLEEICSSMRGHLVDVATIPLARLKTKA